jgi:chromosome segregation ATPase
MQSCLILLGPQASDERNKHLDDLRKANEVLHRDVLRFQQRQQLLEEKKNLEKKLPWLEWRQHLVVVDEHKQLLADARHAFQEHESSARPVVAQLEYDDCLVLLQPAARC